MQGANSTEFDEKAECAVIYLMKEWIDFKNNKIIQRDVNSEKGGTMRLGAYPCTVQKGTLAEQAYGNSEIWERHRHRYEFNNKYYEQLASHGLVFSGLSPDGQLVEIIEIKDHPWFLGCQFHPEFKSRPMEPHPLFAAFIRAALENKKRKC